jgi:type I restriction enzyme M protein
MNVQTLRTTQDLFQSELHAYTITLAIEDKNVLRFHVDYFKPDGRNPLKKGEPLAKRSIIDAILAKHDAATGERRFNAFFATASINDTIEYYELFKQAQAERRAGDPGFVPLKVAAIFSPPAEGNPDVKQFQEDLLQELEDNRQEPDKKKEALKAIIADYNARYGTNHSIGEFDAYYQDVQKRIKDQQYPNHDLPKKGAEKIDITIVVDMLLNGFDAKYLNTLYVDKKLKHHGLIQVFTRTNRVLNASKPYGHILDFRGLQDSDNYEQAAKKELGRDDPDPDAVGNCGRTPLSAWYDDNPSDIPDFEKQMRRKAHYVIQPKHLWANIANMARTQHHDLLNTLQGGFKYIENESIKSTFSGLFSEINLSSEKLGKNYQARNDRLCTIIQEIAKGLRGFSTDADTLGDAYEYLIGQFAAGSGKKAGEFYTPQRISNILSDIVILDCQAPETGARKKLASVLDFACGSGSLLLNVRNRIVDAGGGVGMIYGQEKNITTYNLYRMNMLLHGVKDTEFEIFHGDSLTNEWNTLRKQNPAKKPTFGAVVANPPFSFRWDPKEALNDDMRFKGYGLAPKSTADFAFLLLGFLYLKDDGVMAITLPHGVLFRGGKETAIRKKLLDDGHIDTVTGLPANLFYSTGILVLKKCKKPDDVLIINAGAEDNFEKASVRTI